MASRRMFHIDKIQTDEFLSLTPECQALFFHAMLTADDDGFIARPVAMTRMVGCSRDALETLVKEGFLIRFPSGVVLVKHWHIHNCIRHDRYHESILPERKLVDVNENNEYYLLTEEDIHSRAAEQSKQAEQKAVMHQEVEKQEDLQVPETQVDSLGAQWEPEVRIGKTRIDYDKQDQTKTLLSKDLSPLWCVSGISTTSRKNDVLPYDSNISREGFEMLKRVCPNLIREHPEKFRPPLDQEQSG